MQKIVGRTRSIVTDTLGLLLAVLVTAASVQDSAAGTHLIDQVAAAHPTIRKVWADGGYRQHIVEHAAQLVIDSVGPPRRRGGDPAPAPTPHRTGADRPVRRAGVIAARTVLRFQ